MSHATSMAAGRVVGLWRYPVKSMMGEELNAVEITERGLLGDRAYAVMDTSDLVPIPVLADPVLASVAAPALEAVRR